MIELTFLGDIFPADETFTCGFGIKSKTTESNVNRWIDNIREIVGSADYIIGNLESPLVADEEAKAETFYGSPLFADVLKESGINVLNIANNHIMEHGIEGFNHTLETLHSKGLLTIGEIVDGQSDILTIEQEGTKICMAGFCDERVCNIENPECYASLEESSVFETLERMKDLHPGISIFIFHWGNEYIHFPSLEQRDMAHQLIENGVNLIVGHHPHVIQPYEKYKDGHILYSIGNFCFDEVQSDHFGKGMIAKVVVQNKSIKDILFKGVQVQDMAYSDELVKPMNFLTFEQYFQAINNHYNHLKTLSEDAYQENYEATLRQVHKKERIQMRLSILKKVLSMRHKHKIQLIRNIKHYIV